MADAHLVGVTVAVVKDGRLFFAKGYGQADREQGNARRRRPYPLPRRLGRQGLHRHGGHAARRAGPARPARRRQHLPHRLPGPGDLPAAGHPRPPADPHRRLRGKAGIYARTAADLEPLGAYLRAHAAGAGAPARRTGRLFQPQPGAGRPHRRPGGRRALRAVRRGAASCGRSACAAARPASPCRRRWPPIWPRGYTYAAGAHRAEPFEYVQAAPAGASERHRHRHGQCSCWRTCRTGRYGETRLLQAATAREMQRQHFTNDPRLSGLAYSFEELSRNDQHLLQHGGDTDLFHTMLALLPAQQVGLFVATNTAGGGEAPSKVLEAFLDHYYPVPAMTAPRPPADFAARADRYHWHVSNHAAGLHDPDQGRGPGEPAGQCQRHRGRLSGHRGAGAGPYPVGRGGAAALPAGGWSGPAGLPRRRPGAHHAPVPEARPAAFEKVAWHDAPAFTSARWGWRVLLVLSALLTWPIGGLVHRRRGIARARWPRLARWLAGGTAGLFLVFLVGFVLALSDERQLNVWPVTAPDRRAGGRPARQRLDHRRGRVCGAGVEGALVGRARGGCITRWWPWPRWPSCGN